MVKDDFFFILGIKTGKLKRTPPCSKTSKSSNYFKMAKIVSLLKK
jgi:hypothetical protein